MRDTFAEACPKCGYLNPETLHCRICGAPQLEFFLRKEEDEEKQQAAPGYVSKTKLITGRKL